MPTYISLINWTEQGIKNFKDTRERADAFSELAQATGASLKDVYWTLGEFDLVAITEAPDDETAAALLYQLGSSGNVRTKTLRAFGRSEIAAILAKAE
jgi:uncharacterized protein with GYD domain